MNMEGPEGVKCELELSIFFTGTMGFGSQRLRSTNQEMGVVFG